jgi:hypothetical protein
MRRIITAAAALTALVAIALAGVAGASHNGPGFKTAKQPFLVGTAPGVVVDPILSVGDIVPNGQTPENDVQPEYQMSGIPDGLGAYKHKGEGRWHWFDSDKSKLAVVVMNHELGRSFPNMPPGVDARISRLEVDTKTRSVHRAEHLFTGLEGYERFCSSTLSMIRGRPLYFTGEEAVPIAGQPPGPAHDGSSIVMDPETGMWRDTAHFGHFQHENVVPLKLKKWVFMSSEDDFRGPPNFPVTPSYLYAYIADDFNRALRGMDGGLYVWKSDNSAKNQNSTVLKGERIPGRFVPLTQAENANSTSLKTAATAKDAFRFDRLEDVAVRGGTQRGKSNVTYIADTGKPPFTARGRVFEFVFDKRDPTRATLRMILNGDAPDNDDIYNPDNMDASDRVLMIQEDRESAFRDEPFSGGYGRVMEYRFSDGRLRSVARVNTPPGTPPGSNTENCAGCRRGTWESSGIIDVGHIFGKGWWLLDVQAHNSTAPQPGPTLVPNSSTGENGQLLAMFVPGSQGGDDDDDDDDDD